MGKHHMSHTTCTVMQDILTMNYDELEETYDIDIDDENGTVWDHQERRQFNDLHQWAQFVQDQNADDNYATVSRIGGKHRFDDERW